MQKKFLIVGGWAGWIIGLLALIILGILLPRLHLRILEKTQTWENLLDKKKEAIASTMWKDLRPLIVMAGDSHIELGSWYELFDGQIAVRNCGMSMAKITDVKRLVGSIPDQNPEVLIIMCGINNISHQDNLETCLEDYKELIIVAKERIHPKQIIILGIMPVRNDLAGDGTLRINERVSLLNASLEKLCTLTGTIFLNLNKMLEDKNGGLDYRLTGDGLHLNQKGYRIFSSELSKRLF